MQGYLDADYGVALPALMLPDMFRALVPRLQMPTRSV
jgi:hypothetical protein